MDKLSLELFSIFCLYSSIHYLVQSCYLIKLLLHYSLIPQWYYKNWFRYFCMFSILYISHRTGWRYQCIRDVATNKPILTLKSYQTKTSTLNLTSNVETEIPVQAFIRINEHTCVTSCEFPISYWSACSPVLRCYPVSKHVICSWKRL